ncbi:hypothetical protein ILUMI_04017, partial [Ignelater luminosus]
MELESTSNIYAFEDKISASIAKIDLWISKVEREKFSAFDMLNPMTDSVLILKEKKKEKNGTWQTCNEIESYIGGAQSTEKWQTVMDLKTDTRERALSLVAIKKWKDYYSTLLVEQRRKLLNVNEEDEPAAIEVNPDL